MKENAAKLAPRSATSSSDGRILAIDYGRTRMGLALADLHAQIAEPHSTMERLNRNEDMRRLRELMRDEGVKQVIVGLPLNLDGTRGEMAEEAERFAKRVRKQIGVAVELVDERLTSWEAERVLEEEFGRRIVQRNVSGGRRKRAREVGSKYATDAVAATVILREYLAQHEDAERRNTR